ncbi:MAG: LptA/OstA family protein [Steroidobacteraceae bacterium]
MAFSLRKLLIAAAVLGAAAGVAMAQDRDRLPITVEARSSDFDYKNSVLVFNDVTIVQGPTRITAQKAQASGLDFEDSRWEFSGSVRMTLTDGTLASDTARVRFAKGEIQSATVTGQPATFEQRRQAELAQGHANRIDYDLGRGTVELAGKAWLSDGRNEITGATLVYSTGSQRVISKEQVVITIKPREQAPAPKEPE